MGNVLFIDIFNDLLAEAGLNRKQFSEKSGIPYTTVIGWTTLNRLPDYTALIKIADFFHCSIDYLAGRREDYGNKFFSVELTPREQSHINCYRKLNSENKEIIEKLTKNLIK